MRNFFFFIMLFCACAVMAQNESQTALLQDGDNVQVFHGAGALSSAYDAATAGSTITLSEGFFNNPGDLTKAVSIIGSGSDKTTINSGLFYWAEESTPMQDVILEGVRLNGDIQIRNISGFTVAKCRFGVFRLREGTIENITIRQSQFATLAGSVYVLNMAVLNSILTSRMDYSNENTALLFDHCVIMPSSNCWEHQKAVYQNCIASAGCNTNFGAGSTVKYCICQFGDANTYIKEGNWFGVDPTDLFSDAEGFAYSDDRTYTLTNPEMYVGSDGTEVGLYGGLYPWDMTPSTPVVKNLSLQVDGNTLNVTYEAETR
ncbi:MAG: hypothetical protein K5660_00715 [Paludibacteraceae bacterium]|nr:hypothetical protein [Paludibacteraceae bacterium]